MLIVYIVKLLEKNDYIISSQLDMFMDNLRNLRKHIILCLKIH